MKKKIITILLCAILIFSLVACGNESPAKRIKRITGVTLPKNAEVEYDEYYHTAWLDPYEQCYTVFKFNEEPVDFLSEYNFEVCNEEIKFNKNIFPEEFLPNLETDFLYSLASNYMEMYYFSETKRLFIMLYKRV